MKRIVLLTASALLVILYVPTARADSPRRVTDTQIQQARERVWKCQESLGLPRSPVSKSKPVGPLYRLWVLNKWVGLGDGVCHAVRQLQSVNYTEIREARAWARSPGPACVSSKEGGVTSNTGNGYYGKWQADPSFQRAYGPEYVARWGYAHNWPAYAQDVMAYRGWKSRGWGPWPNTSRMCGLR